MAKWAIELDRLSEGGLSSQYWRENYPRIGTPNQAGRIFAMDLIKPGYLQPGPGLTTFGAASAVTDTITSITDVIVNSNILGHAGSTNDVYEINALTGTVAKVHTVSGHSQVSIYNSEMGINGYGSYLYYAYNHVSGADIGRYDFVSTFNDTWWTSTLSASALQRAGSKVIEIGGNDVMYIANDKYVASYDGTTGQDQALDIPVTQRIRDLRWLNDRLYIITRYNVSDDQVGTPYSSVFIWDGTTDSWEAEIPVRGIASCGFVMGGTFFLFYFDTSGERKLAYLDGNRFVDLTSWEETGGDMPNRYQVTSYKDFILWGNGDDLYGYGPMNGVSPRRLFHLADLGSANAGELGIISNLFSDPGILIGNANTLKYLDFDTAFQKNGVLWKSLMFDIAGDRQNGGQINSVRFNFEKLVSGAVLDWSLVNSQGTTIYSDKISYAKATAPNPMHTLTTAYYPLNGKVTEDFRVELNYANGSTTAPVRVKNIKLYGEG